MNLVRRFFKFTVPSIVSMWIFSLYSLVDGMFVAWGVGEHALTAVNLSLPFVSLVFTLGILLATGTSHRPVHRPGAEGRGAGPQLL